MRRVTRALYMKLMVVSCTLALLGACAPARKPSDAPEPSTGSRSPDKEKEPVIGTVPQS